VSVSECEWVWVSVSECEWVWVSVSVSECEWVWVSVSERVRGKEGRRRTEGASGYRTKNKNPTRQCGEQHGNNPYIIQYLTHITSNIRHIAHLWTWFFTVFHHYTYPSGPIRAHPGRVRNRPKSLLQGSSRATNAAAEPRDVVAWDSMAQAGGRGSLG